MSTLPQIQSSADHAHNSLAERRGQGRDAVVANTVIRGPEIGSPIPVETRNLSATGCQFTSAIRIPVNTRISLGLAGAGSATAIVVRSDGLVHACLFERQLSQADQARAFTGTQVIRIYEASAPEPEPDHRLPRHWRYRLILAAGALCWCFPLAVFALL